MARKPPLFKFAVSDVVQSEIMASALRAQRIRSFFRAGTTTVVAIITEPEEVSLPVPGMMGPTPLPASATDSTGINRAG
jgi:hypothetical protein